MIEIKYKRSIFDSQRRDLARGEMIPFNSGSTSEERALFFGATLLSFTVDQCPTLFLTNLAKDTENPSRADDFFRRLSAYRFPRLSRVFFDDDGANFSLAIIKESLKRVWDWTRQQNSPAAAKTWAICCRGAAFELSEASSRWLEHFSEALNHGKTVSAPVEEEEFELAMRWALAALPTLPSPAADGNGQEFLKCHHPSRAAFLRVWRRSEETEMEAWRAAAWLACKVGGIWAHLFSALLGFSLAPPRRLIAVELPAPHGADHLVALVGAGSAGKTSFLCALAHDQASLPGGVRQFNYQQIDAAGTDWEDVGQGASPRNEWAKGEPFNTRPQDQLRRRGKDGDSVDGPRLIAYDLAGENLSATGPAMEEFSQFIGRFSPSGFVVVLGKTSDLERHIQLCRNLNHVVQRLPNRKAWPVHVLINFSDERFAVGDCRRVSLLGQQPVQCDTEELLGKDGARDSARLLSAISESANWAEHPCEALAFEKAFREFSPAIDLLLQTFDKLIVTFACCAGGAAPRGDNQDSKRLLRQSAVASWLNLTAAVTSAAKVSTDKALIEMFSSRVHNVAAELQELRTLGLRLAALRPPSMAISPHAVQQAKEDWERLQKVEGISFEAALQARERDWSALVESLPGTVDWAFQKPSSRPGDRLFAWLLASLGVPAGLGLPGANPREEIAGLLDGPAGSNPCVALTARQETATDQEQKAIPADCRKWATTPGYRGWSGDVRFSCQWDEGARTIPSEWHDGDGYSQIDNLARQLNFHGTVADLLAKCLKDLDNPHFQNRLATIIRALTHADTGRQRGLFFEQSLERGSPDTYACFAVAGGTRRFERLGSVWACQNLVVEILAHAARLRGTPPLPNLKGSLNAAWLLRLLLIERGSGPLEPKNVKAGWLDIVKTDAATKIVRKLRDFYGAMPRQDDVVRWLKLNQDDPEFRPLMEAADLGEALVRMADERFAGFLDAKLAYAEKSGWFGSKHSEIRWLREKLAKNEITPWGAYAGRQTVANARNYQELFPNR